MLSNFLVVLEKFDSYILGREKRDVDKSLLRTVERKRKKKGEESEIMRCFYKRYGDVNVPRKATLKKLEAWKRYPHNVDIDCIIGVRER